MNGPQRWLRVAAVVMVWAVAGGCSGSSSGDGATTTQAGGQGGDIAEGAPSTTVLVALESLDLSDDDRGCVEEALPDDIDRDEVPSSLLDEVRGSCSRASTFSSVFARRLSEDHSGLYSDEQLGCLGGAYGALSSEEVGALVEAGFSPDEASDEAQGVLEELFGSCGVEPPPP